MCYGKTTDRQDISARLRENEAAPRSLGVTLAALFGSRRDSDTDIVIDRLYTFEDLTHLNKSLEALRRRKKRLD